MAWIVKLVSIGTAGDERSTEVMRIARPEDLTDLATLGLTLAEGKQLLAGVQQELVAAQARRHAARRPACRCCSTTCRVKDYRQHAIATLLLCRMRRDRGRLGVAVAYPLDPGAGSAAGAARRPDALSDGRRGASTTVEFVGQAGCHCSVVSSDRSWRRLDAGAARMTRPGRVPGSGRQAVAGG